MRCCCCSCHCWCDALWHVGNANLLKNFRSVLLAATSACYRSIWMCADLASWSLHSWQRSWARQRLRGACCRRQTDRQTAGAASIAKVLAKSLYAWEPEFSFVCIHECMNLVCIWHVCMYMSMYVYNIYIYNIWHVVIQHILIQFARRTAMHAN